MVFVNNVYFKKINSYNETENISSSAKELLKKIVSEEKIKLEKNIPLKIHFGEKGNETFIHPKNFEGIIDYLKSKKTKPFFTDTNVLYKGERTFSDTHIKIAKEHGFTQIPIKIADGDHGEKYKEIKISEVNPKHFQKCNIGKEISMAKQMIVIAHFKGHILAGYGGAIKQLSMGCAARSGKLAMHSNAKPILNSLTCKKCHTCTKHCPKDALVIDTLVPHIDYNKCIGCAMCIAVCPFGVITPNWISTLPNNFLEKLVEYAFAAQKGKKVIYFNFVFNLTKNCDCEGKKMKPIAKDVGILAGTDPVALDKAALDLIRKQEGKKVFAGDYALDYAQKIGLGKKEYKLIEI